MKKRHHDPIEPKDFARLDQLLESLKTISVQSPPSSARKRLNELYVQRLRDDHRYNVQAGKLRQRFSFWLKPTAACALLIAISIGMMFWVHLHRQDRLRTENNPGVNVPKVSPKNEVRTTSAIPVSKDSSPPMHRSRFAQKHNANFTEMVVRLPYSDSDIATGTSATIQVSMSQAQLVSLGFPLSESLQNRWLIANVTLGDDGLPRAISLPVPLEVIE